VPSLVEIFAFKAGFVEMLLRGTVIYWIVLILVRLAGRREIGSLGTADLLVLLLVADAAGDAMSAGSTSIADGVVVVATIVAWSVVLDRAAYYSPWVQKVLEPQRVCLIKDGRILRSGLRAEHIGRGELLEQLRLKGIESVADVKRAYIEANGQFSIIKNGPEVSKEYSTLEEP